MAGEYLHKLVLEDCKVPTWNIMYSGVHWSKRRKLVDQIHSLVFYSTAEQIGTHTGCLVTKPVILDFEIHYKDKRRRDPDNACIKPFIDGLVQAGLLYDDSTEQIRAIIIKMKIKQPSNKVIIKIIV